MKKIMIAAAVLAALTACNKTLIEGPMADSEYGYINLGVTADTEMEVTTKAGEVYADYLVGLFENDVAVWTSDKGADNGYINYTTAVSAENASLWKVAEGKYEVRVQNMKATAANPDNAKGSMYIYGTDSDVNVRPGETEVATVSCTPHCTAVTIEYAEDFKNTFKEGYSVSVVKDGRSVTMSEGSAESDRAYFNIISGDAVELTWNLSATLKTASTPKYYSANFVSSKAKCTHLKFTTNGNTNGKITVEITVNGEISTVIDVNAEIDPLGGSTTPNN